MSAESGFSEKIHPSGDCRNLRESGKTADAYSVPAQPGSEYGLPPSHYCHECGLDNCNHHAHGVEYERHRILALLQESANETQELWEAKRDSKSASERWQSEYWRGQMNGLHHIIRDIEERND